VIVTSTHPTSATSDRARLALLLLFSVVLRLAWWHFGPKVIESEGCNYARVAESLAAGRGPIGMHELGPELLYPPLYPGLIAACVRFGLSSEMGGRLVSFVFGSLTPIAAWALARRCNGSAAGWWAGGLAVVHPLLIAVSTAVLSDATYMTLMLVLLYLAVEMLELAPRWVWGIAGATAGLAYLVRPEGLILGLTLATLAAALHWREPRASGAKFAVFIGVFAIFAVPYVGYLWHETGHPRFQAKTAHGVLFQVAAERGESEGQIYFGIDDDLTPTGLSNTSDLSQLDAPPPPLSARIRIVAKQIARNLPKLFRGLNAQQFGQPVLALLVGLGLLNAPWDRRRARRELPLLILCALTVGPFLVWPFVLDRSLLMLMGPLLVWAAAGAERLWGWSQSTAKTLGMSGGFAPAVGVAVVGVLAIVFAASASAGVRATDEVSQSWNVALEDNVPVGQWIRQQAGPTRPVVMDSMMAAAYYSGAALESYPWCDAATALRYIDRVKPTFLVLRDTDGGRRPYLAQWIEKVPDDRFVLAKTFTGHTGATRVYRWGASASGPAPEVARQVH
jgi:4-amino-4-deoxy-L-arabinose transferase-like glycosyltransferase